METLRATILSHVYYTRVTIECSKEKLSVERNRKRNNGSTGGESHGEHVSPRLSPLFPGAHVEAQDDNEAFFLSHWCVDFA